MKRISPFRAFLWATGAAVLILLLRWLTSGTANPRYIPAADHAVSPRYSWVTYDYLSPSPFEGGKMWVLAEEGSNYHQILFDIDTQKVLGELDNAAPVFFNSDQTKLLCYQRLPANTNTVWRSVVKFFAARFFSRNRVIHLDQDAQTFWLVDLRRNSAEQVGRDYQFHGAGSTFHPSPNFRYGYDKPSGSFGMPEFYICDLVTNDFRDESVSGWPTGWWDGRQIMIKADNNDLILYDVETRKISPFIPIQKIKSFLADAGLTNDPAKATVFFMWNGHENQFYMTDSDNRWAARKSYLATIGRPGGVLKMVDPHFKFEWSDHFDSGMKYYLYSGRESRSNSSVVFLRNLETGQTRELVPQDSNNPTHFSTPYFYGGSVIYVRSNALWRINLDGTHNRRLFPPFASD